jgi:hypothetical protein
MIISKEQLNKALKEKNAVQRYISRKFFGTFESMGFHLLGAHFYEPIPNTETVQRNHQSQPRACRNINFNFEQAEQQIVKLLERWGSEFYTAVTKYGYDETNPYFRGVDAILLYCFIRETKSKFIIEVGQGVSTSIILAALEDNYQENKITTKFISIDPYSRFDFQNQTSVGVEVEVMPVDLQAVPTTLFSNLGKSDFLFIDSSHVYKLGSDVEYLFEEIYPRIGQGVYIHIHDICSPYHYEIDWYIKQRRFWNEQYFLENFLRFNREFEVITPVYYLTKQSKILKQQCDRICQYEHFSLMGYSFYILRNYSS